MVEGGRQQWHIQRDGEGGYIFQAVSGDPAKARATVNDLLRASNLPFHAEGDAATAYLHVPASQVRAFAAAMSEGHSELRAERAGRIWQFDISRIDTAGEQRGAALLAFEER